VKAPTDNVPAEIEALRWATKYFESHAPYLRDFPQNAIIKKIIEGLRPQLIEKIERGAPLDGGDRILALRLLRKTDKLPRGPKEGDKRSRDGFIRCAMLEIVENWRFHPTRNEASTHACAASIVRKALRDAVNIKLTEPAIRKIWRSCDIRDRKAWELMRVGKDNF
jgi:hypothetical protein